MIVILVCYPLPRFTEIYRTSLAWRCIYAYVSDAAGSENFRQLVRQKEDFFMSCMQPLRRKTQVATERASFEPSALSRSLLEG
jgi:hypothetical protein